MEPNLRQSPYSSRHGKHKSLTAAVIPAMPPPLQRALAWSHHAVMRAGIGKSRTGRRRWFFCRMHAAEGAVRPRPVRLGRPVPRRQGRHALVGKALARRVESGGGMSSSLTSRHDSGVGRDSASYLYVSNGLACAEPVGGTPGLLSVHPFDIRRTSSMSDDRVLRTSHSKTFALAGSRRSDGVSALSAAA